LFYHSFHYLIFYEEKGIPMKFYSAPEIKIGNITCYAQGQYTFLITAEGCDSLVGSNEFQLTQNSILICGGNISDLQNSSTPLVSDITCLNIPGTFTITSNNSEAEFGGGLNCVSGQSISVPYTVSPELPEDCIVDTLTELGCASNDACSSGN
jgi:hypothetical protein